MESPFDNANNVCSLYLEPVLNNYYKMYQNIITINNIPPGPLANLIARVNTPRLSTFIPNISTVNYTLVVSRYPFNGHCAFGKNQDQFMYAEDIPNIIGYLEKNGYVIMYNVTDMAHKGRVEYTNRSSKKFLFSFYYNSANASLI
jgi:hypothetical protein